MDNYKVRSKKESRKKRRKALRASATKVPVSVYISLAIGVISLLSFIVVCIISALSKGEGNMLVGVIPIAAGIANMTGLVLAYRCLQMDDVRNRWVSMAAIVNGILLILYLLLYIYGMPEKM